jgi:integrase
LKRGVAASTQNQAFCALLFLMREVLGRDTACLNSLRAKSGPHLPVVFSEKEVAQLLGLVHGMPGLMLRLCYGSGLRVSECVSLRVKDLDFEQGLLYVRRGKGDKDRTTLLPGCIRPLLKEHLERVKKIHGRELAAGRGDMELPDRLAPGARQPQRICGLREGNLKMGPRWRANETTLHDELRSCCQSP